VVSTSPGPQQSQTAEQARGLTGMGAEIDDPSIWPGEGRHDHKAEVLAPIGEDWSVKTTSPRLTALVDAARQSDTGRFLFGKRLAIIVPYRERKPHLDRFVPHMLAYFARDKLDAAISYSITVVEQASDGMFNAGKLKNVGFRLAAPNHDYVCFHDVDYLPIWADYSFAGSPARLIWHGLRLKENYANFFGAVVLFNTSDFAKVNGYSNSYLGWGFEDTDLLHRCIASGLTIEHRDDTFRSLSHAHRGLTAGGTWTAEALRNRELFNARMAELKATGRMPDDGLSRLDFVIEEEKALAPAVKLVRVRI
jgi:xylosylprotein 4-beta-galactosyltransferase